MSNYTKCIIFSFTLYQWNFFCTKVFFCCFVFVSFIERKGLCPFSVCFYVLTDGYCFHFQPCWWTWNVLVPLYCGKSVCSDTQQSFSRKHLSHSLDCFNNSSIVSFALVQGIDPGSLCVIEFLCRCWVTYLVPHHCRVEGQLRRWKTGPRDWVKGDNGDMTNPYRPINDIFILVLSELYRAAWISTCLY